MTLLDIAAIGERVCAERQKLNLSRDKLAEMAGITSYFMGQIERGERNMSLNTLDKISECLHVSAGYLIDGNREASTNIGQLQELISRCNENEVNLFIDVLKAALPHLRKFE